MQDEADLAAALFFELRSVLMEAHKQKKEGLKATRVGVITPYRQQRKCLQDTFNALCGEFAKEVCLPSLCGISDSLQHHSGRTTYAVLAAMSTHPRLVMQHVSCHCRVCFCPHDCDNHSSCTRWPVLAIMCTAVARAGDLCQCNSNSLQVCKPPIRRVLT